MAGVSAGPPLPDRSKTEGEFNGSDWTFGGARPGERSDSPGPDSFPWATAFFSHGVVLMTRVRKVGWTEERIAREGRNVRQTLIALIPRQRFPFGVHLLPAPIGLLLKRSAARRHQGGQEHRRQEPAGPASRHQLERMHNGFHGSRYDLRSKGEETGRWLEIERRPARLRFP